MCGRCCKLCDRCILQSGWFLHAHKTINPSSLQGSWDMLSFLCAQRIRGCWFIYFWPFSNCFKSLWYEEKIYFILFLVVQHVRKAAARRGLISQGWNPHTWVSLSWWLFGIWKAFCPKDQQSPWARNPWRWVSAWSQAETPQSPQDCGIHVTRPHRHVPVWFRQEVPNLLLTYSGKGSAPQAPTWRFGDLRDVASLTGSEELVEYLRPLRVCFIYCPALQPLGPAGTRTSTSSPRCLSPGHPSTGAALVPGPFSWGWQWGLSAWGSFFSMIVFFFFLWFGVGFIQGLLQ